MYEGPTLYSIPWHSNVLSICVECSFSPVYLPYLPGIIFEVSPDHIHTTAPATVTVAALHICIH